MGCAVSAPFGLFDVQAILNAQWVGVPFRSWPGFDVTPDVEFWALLPAFVVVTLVGAIETIGRGGPTEVERFPSRGCVKGGLGLRFDGSSAPGGGGDADQSIVG